MDIHIKAKRRAKGLSDTKPAAVPHTPGRFLGTRTDNNTAVRATSFCARSSFITIVFCALTEMVCVANLRCVTPNVQL